MVTGFFENSIPMKSHSWVWKYFSISSEDPSIACSIYDLRLQEVTKKKSLKLLAQKICCVILTQSIKK